MTPQEDGQIAYDVKTAARKSCLSEWEIRKAIGSGELRAGRRGRRIVIHRSDLDRFIRTIVDSSAA
jgi:excisionase family DNA binding protein